ncbi:MAG TPA: ATP-binding protein [Nocardioidaceae bacterium]|nr:ATP-binding protein [Nocardioidaceae bacterium]
MPTTPLNLSELPLDLLVEAAADPVVTHLADTIDREFLRRDPAEPSAYDFAAAQLGVDVQDLLVLSDHVGSIVAHSVGCWLLRAHETHGGALVGGNPSTPPASELVEGVDGDVYGFRSATVVLPAGALHAAPVVLRIARPHYQYVVELMAARSESEGLSEVFTAFMDERRRRGSPYYRGAYLVDVDNTGLVLKRWSRPTATRDSLKLDDGVWRTVERTIHRVLEHAPALETRGLGTSSGVLLVGPPGTGKTQLGTVVAAELLGRVTVLVPGSHASEHYLTELFELAGHLSPSLVLMDDLDLVAGERGTMNPHKLREFLGVMDGGLADRSGVVVVASTNDHKRVDKAAQRSSRFDTVIRLDPPSYDGRLAILMRYLDWCDEALDLETVATSTDGATGADLKELVRYAVLETNDAVTTEALLEAARDGRWQRSTQPAGVYL